MKRANWIKVAQDSDRCLHAVNTVVEPHVVKKGNFWSACKHFKKNSITLSQKEMDY